jgi:beta-alanine degradation protein BauB
MQSRSFCVLMFLGSFALVGQDFVRVASAGMVKAEYEEPHVPVLRLTETPGAKLPMHSHPAYVIVGLMNNMSRYTFPDGRSSEEKTKVGQAMFSQAVAHASENIGDTAMRP